MVAINMVANGNGSMTNVLLSTDNWHEQKL